MTSAELDGIFAVKLPVRDLALSPGLVRAAVRPAIDFRVPG
ncbi:MAG: hypothetical protein ACRDQH_10650 [Pseudonocardiaceae bacterium]